MKSTGKVGKGLIFGIAALTMVMGISIYFGYTLTHNRIYKGISIGEVNVSGLTKAQAVQKVKSDLDNMDKTNLTLKYADKKWQIPYNQINAKFNVEQAVEKAYLVGRSGNIMQRVPDIISVRSGKRFDVAFGYDKQLLVNFITGIQKEIDVPKKNARLVSKGGKVVVEPQISGKKLDLDKTVSLADNHITKLATVELELPVIEDQPTVLAGQLSDFNDELGAFSTTFNTNDTSRTKNIKLACSRINGTILQPGQVYSMDSTIKNRTSANGYKVAKAYFQDEVVNEVGGGVCQVTTTLYDAALYANLSIIERSSHTMMVDYVDPGFDAAVSDKGVDLKFKNSYKFPIYLYSMVEGNKINMKVFGKKEDPTQKVQLETEVTDIIYVGPDQVIADSSLPKGTKKVEVKPRNGYKATLYKFVYRNGTLISKEKVSQSSYQPRQGKIRVGA